MSHFLLLSIYHLPLKNTVIILKIHPPFFFQKTAYANSAETEQTAPESVSILFAIPTCSFVKQHIKKQNLGKKKYGIK